MDRFVEALLADVREQLEFFQVEQVPTVFVGGGTPSVLGASRMERLLGGLAALLARRGVGEFTVEANPESADEDFLRSCRDGGVNRISLGVQSFHEPSRRAVHRVGEGSLLSERLELVSRYFPGAFSVDLMAGLPFQNETILLCDIERVLAFEPAHISLYSLTVEPGTPLERNIAGLSLPPGDEADAVWLAGRDALEAAGFEQYEVSNFARPGRQCAHNVRYWRMENWLGAGPAASGTVIAEGAASPFGRRYTYGADIAAYLSRHGSSAHVEELDRDALIRESLLMGFRYREGPDPAIFRRRFSRSIEDYIPQTIARWRERGFFAACPGHAGNLAPSGEGLLFLDGFLRDAFAELGHSVSG
ncbi:coproporphyrinogen III oxidase [Spirochaetia bacterium]|nr:coproporphyrinogen III oxidase [Spirochaetia bacterium]